MCSGVSFSDPPFILTLAPWPKRHSTTSGLPASMARCKAEKLSLVSTLTSSPFRIMALMTPMWPFSAAMCKLLAPFLSSNKEIHLSLYCCIGRLSNVYHVFKNAL